jgi:hypothetical protein
MKNKKRVGDKKVAILNRFLFFGILFSIFFSTSIMAADGTGGNITHDGAYTVHTFLTNGTFVPPTGTINVSVLVVAGGGGGGAGGGGGGGLIYNNSYIVVENVTVVVGAGGARHIVDGNPGNSGGNSSFGNLTSIGGGGGGGNEINGVNGGSGGGGGAAGGVQTEGGSGILGQGYGGGGNNNYRGPNYPAGGGGGAGAIGQTAPSDSVSGAGGNGLNYSINGSNVYYAGGGGGMGGTGSTTPGAGGLGGGANGSQSEYSDAIINTGGGGGGGTDGGDNGGAGGSGIVIIRYLTPESISPTLESLSPTNHTPTGNTSINFTANISDASGIKNATLNVFRNNVLYNKTYFSDTPTTGYALRFNGSNYIQSATASLPSGSAFTYAMWINPNFTSYQQPFVHWGSSSNPRAYWRMESAGRMYFDMGITNPKMYWDGSLFCSSNDCNGNVPAYSNGNWYFVVLTGTYTGSSLTNAPILIGSGNPTHAGRYFNGAIDEVLIFNRSLNSTEISQLYNNGSGLYANTSIAPFNSGLVAGYHLDEGSGTTIRDITGRYNGTTSGSPSYSTGKVSQLSDWVNYTSGSLSYIFSRVYNLIDGIYTWFFESYDVANNYNVSENFTLTVDASAPQISFSSADGSGGVITHDGAYTIHTFLTNGTFVPPISGMNASVLVVGGGGAGGARHAGGGGGGGVIYIPNATLNLSSYNIIVGAGGPAGTAGLIGANGQSSFFGVGAINETANGGGGGGVYPEENGANGGSGGGGGSNSGVAPAGTASQPVRNVFGIALNYSNAGGVGYGGCSNDLRPGGGGGGAGAVGGNAACDANAGNGGNGIQINISGSYYYGAGGGGSMWAEGSTSYTAGSGGLGGGGGGGGETHTGTSGPYGSGGTGGINNGTNGSENLGGDAGANTGSGGGAAAQYYAPYGQYGVSGAGGSGIVIVRYLTPTSVGSTEVNNSGKARDYVYARISLVEANLKNISFGIYNSSWSNVTNYVTNITSINWTNLVDGSYYYNVSACDTFDRCNSTETRKITLDITNPNGTLVSPENNTLNALSSVNFTANISDNLGIKNVTLNIYNSTSLVNSTVISYAANVTQTTIGIVVTLIDGVYSWFYSIFDWAGNIGTSTNNTITIDRVTPSITNIRNISADYTLGNLDPQIIIIVNATVTDSMSGVNSVILQFYNGTWINYTMANLSSIYSTNVTLNQNDSNYVYNIWANDSAGNINVSTNRTFSANWDCTWNVSTTSLDAVSGFYTEKDIGNFTITNTGDSNYSGGCVVKYINNFNSFSDDYYRASFKTSLRGIGFSADTILSPGENKSVNSRGAFPNSEIVLQEHPVISITSNITDTEANLTNRYINATMIVAKGVVLYQEVEQPTANLNIELTNQTFDWIAYVRNLGADGSYNNSAHNVTFNWTISSQSLINKIINGTGILNESVYSLLNDSAKQYSNLSFNFTKENLENEPLVINTPITVKIYSYGYKNESNNFSLIDVGNNQTLLESSFNVTFLCNSVGDGICISSCKTLDGDWNVLAGCNEPAAGGQTGSSGGGGGGGGGGGSFDKSSATFELVRGENQEFDLVLENKLSSAKKDITITVKGNNSQYVIPTPSTIDYLGANSKENVKFLINAPSYFASGKYLLEITFSGTIEGNVSTKFTEVKYVTLTILEMKRVTADEYLNSSLEILSKMNSSGLILDEVQSILDSMNTNYNSLNFMTLKEEADKIEEIYTATLEYSKLREELNQSMIESEKNGVETSETKKLFLLAEILFNRGDYVAAYEKMKEAKTSYLLETKGEFKILYAIKNNPIETLGILVSLSAIGLGSGYFLRLKLLKRKLRMLTEEEGLLLQLMRVVQRDCFESNKMSMEEYGESMYQYEARLSFVIQDKVTTETQIANLMKLGGKKKALGQEKDRLTILIRQTQDDYMNRGKLDTRIYENMLKTYATRLSKIEEQLVFMEAQEQIDQVNGFWKRLFDRK